MCPNKQNNMFWQVCHLNFFQKMYIPKLYRGRGSGTLSLPSSSSCISKSTTLQKLSKCEVKAWHFWNLIILQTLRFYMKSNFGKFKRSKNVIFGNFRDSELWILVKFGLEIRTSKIAKNGILALFELSEIWLAVKLYYVNKDKP